MIKKQINTSKLLNGIVSIASLGLLAACQTAPQSRSTDYQTVDYKCPTITQLTREYRERLVVSKDMVVRWSDENNTGEPRILLILNEKGVSAYNALSKKGLAPALNIGKHTFVPKANTGITQGFLTLDNLPDGWSEVCTEGLFAK